MKETFPKKKHSVIACPHHLMQITKVVPGHPWILSFVSISTDYILWLWSSLTSLTSLWSSSLIVMASRRTSRDSWSHLGWALTVQIASLYTWSLLTVTWWFGSSVGLNNSQIFSFSFQFRTRKWQGRRSEGEKSQKRSSIQECAEG